MTAGPLPRLETDRLVLRVPAAHDAEGFIAFATSDRARHVGGPMSRPDAWQMLATVIGHWTLRGFGLWAVCLRGTDTAIGTAGCLHPEGWPEGELAWHLWSGEAEGRGFAAEAVTAARRHAYDTLGWTGAVSYIGAGNGRSIRLAERLGASPDPAAARPAGMDCLVFRHPGPEAA